MGEKLYEVYREERRSLIDAKYGQSRSLDKYILTLAAGSFGLSLLFIRQIVPHPEAGTIWILVSAWAAFGASILSTLISFLLSQEAFLKQLKILDKWYKESDEYNHEEIKNEFATWTKRLNCASMSLFIIGVIFLIIFSALNLLA